MIAGLCKKHNAVAIMDEVYEWMTYTGQEHIRMGMLLHFCVMHACYWCQIKLTPSLYELKNRCSHRMGFILGVPTCRTNSHPQKKFNNYNDQ